MALTQTPERRPREEDDEAAPTDDEDGEAAVIDSADRHEQTYPVKELLEDAAGL